MTENGDVLKKRQALKAEIATGQYQSLARVILDGTGRLIHRFTFSETPPPFWYNSAVFVLVTQLFCTLIVLFLGDTISNAAPATRTNLTVAGELAVLVGASFVIAAAITHRRLMTTLSDKILDTIETAEDLDDLRSWLKISFNMNVQLLSSLVPAFIIFPLLNIFLTALSGIELGLTVHIVAVIAGFQAFMGVPMLWASLTMPYRLSNYDLKLFAADPSSSEVIDCLSDALNGILLTAGLLLALLTILGFSFIPSETFIYVTLPLPWLILIAVFFSGQYALAKMINKAKWKTLNTIQAQIEALQDQEEILGEETLGHINELLDYHNRIRTTRNSALDIRAGLSFLNSLLLPVLAFLLANLDKVPELF